jgi:hypothetical protein
MMSKEEKQYRWYSCGSNCKRLAMAGTQALKKRELKASHNEEFLTNTMI